MGTEIEMCGSVSRLMKSVVAVCLFIVTADTAPEAQTALRLTVRIHDVTQRGVAERAEAAAVASESLRAAAIQLSWRDCSPDVVGPRPDACAIPLEAGELAIRLVDAPPRADARVLGFSYIDVGKRAGTLATVYSDRVATIANTARRRVGELLGYAVAHEIVHLLVGSQRHSKDGLMRARWNAGMLRGTQARQWAIAGDDAAAMRRGLAARLAGPALLLVRQPSDDTRHEEESTANH
jgi:hypothetical protein